MTIYRILITPTALQDIDQAFCYYNAKLDGLGFEVTAAINAAFQKIAGFPNAYLRRYKDVRGKLLKRFSYLTLFQIDEISNSIKILRVFNTYQKPYW